MSDMKCPFCGKKLWYDEQDGIYRCMKKFACVMHYEGGTEQLWQELIRTRKALELAITGLKNCKTRDHIGAVCRIPEYVDKILEQINTIIKGDQ